MVLVLIITMLFPIIAIFFPRNELVILSVRINYRLLLFSSQVVSDSLQPYGLQHIRPPCPSPPPGVCPNSCPLNQWCHPTISSSDALFFCRQPFLASGSSPMSLLLTSGQSIQLQHQSFQGFVLLAYAMVIKNGKISEDWWNACLFFSHAKSPFGLDSSADRCSPHGTRLVFWAGSISGHHHVSRHLQDHHMGKEDLDPQARATSWFHMQVTHAAHFTGWSKSRVYTYVPGRVGVEGTGKCNSPAWPERVVLWCVSSIMPTSIIQQN